MVKTPIYINNISSVSALGTSTIEIWESYKRAKPLFKDKAINDKTVKVSPLTKNQEAVIQSIAKERKLYNSLDKATLLAIATARNLYHGLNHGNKIGVNIGSSRGATHTFEMAHRQFIELGEVPFMTSPMTTLGNVASTVAQDLGLKGPTISHSITCSSALHALLNAYAFLKSGMIDHFIIGGTEAPLTHFTIKQMQALKLYALGSEDFVCRSLDFEKKENTLVLGEAACLASLSLEPQKDSVQIAGLGYATEQIEHSVSLSGEANCLQSSMQMALEDAELDSVDVAILHAPGTVKGDMSELKAVKNTFKALPALTTNKFMIGHTFGASGAMSLEMAYLMIKHNQFIENPFYKNLQIPEKIETVMVNAVGFGGNAVSVILKKLN